MTSQGPWLQAAGQGLRSEPPAWASSRRSSAVPSERDEATTVGQAAQLADGIQGARHAVIEGGAHLCNVEFAEFFPDRVVDHLDRSSSDQRT